MKTLLRGGPLNGRIIDTTRKQFGYGERKDVYRKGVTGDHLLRTNEVYYEGHHLPDETHPCKKQGKVRVFKFMPEGRGQ